MDKNYYFLVPYFRRAGSFFATDIQKSLTDDEYFFTKAAVLAGINYYIREGKIVDSDKSYSLGSGNTLIKKYTWIESKRRGNHGKEKG